MRSFRSWITPPALGSSLAAAVLVASADADRDGDRDETGTLADLTAAARELGL